MSYKSYCPFAHNVPINLDTPNLRNVLYHSLFHPLSNNHAFLRPEEDGLCNHGGKLSEKLLLICISPFSHSVFYNMKDKVIL